MLSFDHQQMQRFRKAVNDDEATFFFVPSSDLKRIVTSNDDPIISQLPQHVKEAILLCREGDGIVTDSKLVLSFIEGTIDERNGYMLRMGEIRIVGVGDMKLKNKSPKIE